MTLDGSAACVIDLDGVVWLAGTVLPGAAEGVDELRRRGVPVRFVTNNSAPTVHELLDRLRAAGIDAVGDEVVTSGQAAASLLAADERAYVVGGDGILEALAARGVVVDSSSVDAVVVGLAEQFDYAQCHLAARLVRGGARFIATNVDPTLPTPDGLRPGAGAIVAAIATAVSATPEVAGKPSAVMARLVCAMGPVGAVIGDRASTDGAFAATLSVPFAHVASAVGDDAPDADVRASNLHEAVLGLCR